MTGKTISGASAILHLFSEKSSEQIGLGKMRSTIKIVKTGQRNEAKKEEPERKQTPEQSARGIVIVVKGWVTEWKDRKRTLTY
jgi:hypothetical protein